MSANDCDFAWAITEVSEEVEAGKWTWDGREVWLMDFPTPASICFCWVGSRELGPFFCSSCWIWSNIPSPLNSRSRSCRPASLSTSSSSVIASGATEDVPVRGYRLKIIIIKVLFKAHKVHYLLQFRLFLSLHLWRR